MKTQALFLSALGFGTMAKAGHPENDGIAPSQVSCGDYHEDVKCGWQSLFDSHPMMADRDDLYVSCIQGCRHRNGLNRLIYHNDRYLDMSLEEFDEYLKAEESGFASTATVTKVAATVTVGGQPASTGFKTVFRTVSLAAQPSDDASVALDKRSAAEDLQTMGPGKNHDNHHCNNDSVQRKCHWKASWHIFDKEKHYNKCIQKCVRKHNGDNYGSWDDEDDEGDVLVTKRSETVNENTNTAALATTKEPGPPWSDATEPCDSPFWQTYCNANMVYYLEKNHNAYNDCMQMCEALHKNIPPTQRSESQAEILTAMDAKFATAEVQSEGGPCDSGTWAHTWCTVKASLSWNSWETYNKCLDECTREHRLDDVVVKRSEIDTVNDTADIADASVSMINTEGPVKFEGPGYDGHLGETNNHDDHHCNDWQVQGKCGLKATFMFWRPKKTYFKCIGECVQEYGGDNWTEEDFECDHE